MLLQMAQRETKFVLDCARMLRLGPHQQIGPRTAGRKLAAQPQFGCRGVAPNCDYPGPINCTPGVLQLADGMSTNGQTRLMLLPLLARRKGDGSGG